MKNRKLMVSILAGIMAAVLLLSLILSLIPTKANAASSSEIRNQINEMEKQKEELAQQMEDLQNQYQQNEDEIANIVAQKNLIDQEINLLYKEIILINDQISSYNLLIADKQEEVDEAQARFDDMSREYKDRIRAMEEDGSLSYWEVLFKANSFSDFLDRLNMVEEIAASDQRRLEELNEAADEVEAAQTALEEEKAGLEEKRKELDATEAELSAKQLEAGDLILELIEKGDELMELYEGFEMEEESLMLEIAQKEKEYNQARQDEIDAYWAAYWATYVPPETTTATVATDPIISTGGSNVGGSEGTENTTGGEGETQGGSEETDPTGETDSTGETETTEATQATEATQPPRESWGMPCSYVKLTSPFGNRESPTAGASSFHQGVDLAGPEGTPIYAARSGKVTVASYSGSAGNYVTINHMDGFSSIYMHMTSYVVSAGQTVSKGQLIGYMGATGITTGSHLHFGIAYNGAYVNPAGYIYFY